MELRSTLSATPLDLASPLNQTIQTSPPSSPSTPNRIVALPLEYGSPPTTAAQPPQSSLSSLKRSLSTKGDTLKRSFSTSSSKVKENLVSIKGLKRTSSSGAYERLDPLSEAPEEDLGHWLCCQEQDDISPWPVSASRYSPSPFFSNELVESILTRVHSARRRMTLVFLSVDVVGIGFVTNARSSRRRRKRKSWGLLLPP